MDHRCCHRTARLSKGVHQEGRLARGHHGWEVGSDGTVLRVPQFPPERRAKGPGPARTRTPACRAAARRRPLRF